MNQFGSYRRLELALGAPLDELAGRIGELCRAAGPQGPRRQGQGARPAARARLVRAQDRRSRRRFREVVVDPPDLGVLPVLTTWPGDGGPFITLPVVVTKDREGRRNAGMYRLQVYDGRTTGMHWHVHHDGAANFREADGRLEVAVALGTDPAVTYAATAPLPAGIDEFMFAGFLRGEPVELAPCATVDLEVPADAEIVLEGYVEQGRDAPRRALRRPHRLLLAGRRLPRLSPHRHEPCAATPSTRRPSSAARPWRTAYLGKATERLFLPLLRLTLPEIVDLELPIEGVFHDCAIVSHPQGLRRATPAR